jgi:hypothetical protein
VNKPKFPQILWKVFPAVHPPGDEFFVGSGPENFYDASINNKGSVAFTGGISAMCSYMGVNFLDYDQGVFRFDGETTTTIATLGLPISGGLIEP